MARSLFQAGTVSLQFESLGEFFAAVSNAEIQFAAQHALFEGGAQRQQLYAQAAQRFRGRRVRVATTHDFGLGWGPTLIVVCLSVCGREWLSGRMSFSI